MEKEKEVLYEENLLAKLLSEVSESGRLQGLAYLQGIKDREQLIKIV